MAAFNRPSWPRCSARSPLGCYSFGLVHRLGSRPARTLSDYFCFWSWGLRLQGWAANAIGPTSRVQCRANEQRNGGALRTTLASIGDAVIATDELGLVTFLNPVAVSLTGWTTAEAAGLPLEQVFCIVNESSRQPVENPASKALRDGVVVGLANHTVLVAKDGTELPIDDSAAPIKDEHGRVSGCVLVFRDVAKQRQAGACFKLVRTARGRCSRRCSTDHQYGSHGYIFEFNGAAERTFGYNRDDVLGSELAAIIIPPGLRESHRQGLARYLATGEGPVLNQRLELSALHSNGSEFDVELTVTRIPVEGPPQFTAYLRDISDRKCAERELAERASLAAFQAEVGVVLTHEGDLSKMLSRCCEVLVQHLDGAFARIWTLNAKEGVLELQASAGIYTHLDGPHSRVRVGQFKIGDWQHANPS